MANIINTDVNQFPSLTWNHLSINRTHLDTSVETGIAFECSELCDGFCAEQQPFDRISDDVSGLETGLGKAFDAQFDAVLSAAAVPVQVFTVRKGSKGCRPVVLRFTASGATAAVADVVIKAEKDSDSTFIFDFESSAEVTGSCGYRVRVLAEENASVKVVAVNLLGKKLLHFSSIGSRTADNAHVEVIELQLGGGTVFSGDMQNLSGVRSSFSGQVGYMTDGERSLDINYVARQTGRETDSRMNVDGVVMDSAKKTWRGTIDFVRGCEGAKGDEQENVLLLSPDVENKTLPVILCDEEDVDGRHGASVGRLGQSLLFYMESRGIDEQSAKKMMVKAKIASVCRFIPESSLVERITAFVEEAFDR